MNISPLNVNIKPQTISDFGPGRRFVRGMASRTLAPLILLEAFVTAGRTHQAHKRGGFDEARERLTEESIGAAFWFAGVKAFNKINDKIGKLLVGFKNTDFDVHGDSIRKPLTNYMKDTGGKFSKTKIAGFKFTKVAASILFANVLVGFVVPKINQGVTRAYHAADKKFKPQVDFEQFRTMGHEPNFGMKKFLNNKKVKQTSFTGTVDKFLSLAHHFENDTTYQLLSTDVGISGGRAISARNNHERIEILWRDVSSIFFYMFNMALVNKGLNLIQHERPTRLNPVAAKQVTDYMKDVLKADGHKTIPADKFAQMMLGDIDVSSSMKKVESSFKDGAIKLDDFLNILKKEFGPEDYDKYSDLAKRMSKLQPQIDGVSMLAKSQAEGLFKGGAINTPEFLDNVFTVAKGSEKGIANHKNPYKFVAQGELDGIKNDVVKYVKTTIKKAKTQGKEITSDMLESACKMNFMKNAFNWGVGFAISALFLSTIIPKIQYWITKKATGQDQFPGTADYSYEKK